MREGLSHIPEGLWTYSDLHNALTEGNMKVIEETENFVVVQFPFDGYKAKDSDILNMHEAIFKEGYLPLNMPHNGRFVCKRVNVKEASAS